MPEPADLWARIHDLERRVAGLERGQLVLATAVAFARWLVPITVSIAAVVVVILD